MSSFVGELQLSFAGVSVLDGLALNRRLQAADHSEGRQHRSDQAELEPADYHGGSLYLCSAWLRRRQVSGVFKCSP